MSKNSLLVGDCLQILSGMPENCIDLVVCDLPYGKVKASWDKQIDLDSLWSQYTRVCKPGSVVALFATQPFASSLIRSNEAGFRYDLIWVKNKSTGHLNANKMPMRKHEHILIFYSNPSRYYPQKSEGHLPTNSFYTRCSGETFGKADKATTGGGSTSRFPTSVLHFPTVNNNDPSRIHSAQKPIDLLSYLIQSYSKPGDVVLDNCSGSGSVAVAATKQGRGFVCIEKDENIASLSLRWLEECGCFS